MIRDKPVVQFDKRLCRLFWDVDISEIDLSAHAQWVVERVLEYGDFNDVQALILSFGRSGFLDIVSRARFSSRKTMRFWETMLKQEGVSCTRKFSRETAWIC